MSGLSLKECVPCRGGVPPLTGEEIAKLLAQSRPFEPRIEQSLGCQQTPQPFDAGEQFTDSDGADLRDPKRQGAAARPVGELAEHDDAAALGDRHR